MLLLYFVDTLQKWKKSADAGILVIFGSWNLNVDANTDCLSSVLYMVQIVCKTSSYNNIWLTIWFWNKKQGIQNMAERKQHWKGQLEVTMYESVVVILLALILCGV